MVSTARRIGRRAGGLVRRVAGATARWVRGRWVARRATRQLELGRDAEGTSFVLDFRTGQVQPRRRPVPTTAEAPLVPFAHADDAWIQRVIALAGYLVERDEDDDLVVHSEAGSVIVLRCESVGMVRFIVPVLGDTDLLGVDRLQMVNTLNAEANAGRWYLNNEGALLMECDLPATAGITSAQLLGTLRACTHQVCILAVRNGLDRLAA